MRRIRGPDRDAKPSSASPALARRSKQTPLGFVRRDQLRCAAISSIKSTICELS
jgi:hypothetical protein